MKNYTETLNDLAIQRWQGNNGSTGTTSSIKALRRSQVSSTGIVHGDHIHPNNWSYVVRRTSSLYGNMTVVIPQGVYTNEGILADVSLPVIPVLPTYLYNDLIDRLNEKVRGGIDLSVDAFQAGQTKRMFSASSQLEDLARQCRTRGRGVAKIMSSLWLQWQYGWRPLIGTIHDAGEKLIEHNLKRLVFKVRISEQLKPPKAGTIAMGGPAHVKVGQIQPTSFKASDGYECKIRMRASNSALQYLAGWSSLNPISIAWELVPYSFVVDWFFDLGGYMRNLETALLFNSAFESGYISSLQAMDVRMKAAWAGNGSGQGEYTAMYRRFNRTALTSYPLPRIPSFRCDLGSGRLLNAAALLAQQLK